MAIELAATFLENEKYYKHNKNHIITYSIGMALTKKQIEKNPNLKFSERGKDVGVIVSWNTMSRIGLWLFGKTFLLIYHSLIKLFLLFIILKFIPQF